jgi:serine/threonine-protein kinase RsbW
LPASDAGPRLAPGRGWQLAWMEHSLTVRGRYDRLEQIARFIEQAGEAAGLDTVAICRCQLAVDEACTNIIEHGYQGEDRGSIELECAAGQGELIITISDQARPFDAEAVPQPHLGDQLDDVQVGGLGLYFMRQVMDAVEFTREDGVNKLVLVKRREAGEPEAE